jgi:hypothetical protein
MRNFIKPAAAASAMFVASLIAIFVSFGFKTPFNEGGNTDKTTVLQLSLDIPGLQDYFPSKATGGKQAVRILQYPVSFPSDIQLSKFGVPVVFLSERNGVEGLDAYLNFTEFNVQENTASVSFNITYNRNTSTPNSRKVVVKLEKSNDSWSVTESSVNQ